MGDFAMNFAFADGNLALCEQLRQKGEKLKFSHKDIRQALLDGRLDIILWLEKWYRKKWEYYCRNYYPLPNAIMGGNIGLVQKIWQDLSVYCPGEEECGFFGSQRPLYYASESGNSEMIEWVEEKLGDKTDERILLECIWSKQEDLALWLLENREFSVTEISLSVAQEDDSFCPRVLEKLKEKNVGE
ncbi:hypothetical protein ISTM_44 [Insectomime virus]|nr:hypothetical protein ISTM_44 [Insectomime virus]